MNKINTTYYHSPFGELIIGTYANKLCLCDWRYRKTRTQIDTRLTTSLQAEYDQTNNSLINNTIKQLEDYFLGERTAFDLPLLFVGTTFQQNVWNELLQIPFGSSATYLQQAIKLGNKKAIRAVAAANGANALSIIVPCHRIIGSNNELIGYAGGIAVKQKLLQLENTTGNQSRTQTTLF